MGFQMVDIASRGLNGVSLVRNTCALWDRLFACCCCCVSSCCGGDHAADGSAGYDVLGSEELHRFEVNDFQFSAGKRAVLQRQVSGHPDFDDPAGLSWDARSVVKEV